MNLFFFTLFLGFVSPNMEGQGKQPIQAMGEPKKAWTARMEELIHGTPDQT